MNHECQAVDEVYDIYQSQIPLQALNQRERLSSRGVQNISVEDDERLYEIFEKCHANTVCGDCVIWCLYSGALSVVEVSEKGAVISGGDHKYEIRRERLGAFCLTDETRKTKSKTRVDLVRK